MIITLEEIRRKYHQAFAKRLMVQEVSESVNREYVDEPDEEETDLLSHSSAYKHIRRIRQDLMNLNPEKYA